jgi:anti-sigma B factor antagonist
MLSFEKRSMDVIALAGEIDLAIAPAIRAELAPLLDAQPPLLLVDMSGVGFIDSSGIALLVEAFQRQQEHGGRFGLFGLRDNVLDVFQITSLDQILGVHPDEAAARRG